MAAASSWEQDVQKMFREADIDGSGTLTKQDVFMMLLLADKDEKRDPMFKMNVRFLRSVLENADKDHDEKITFEEFKDYISKAAETPK